MGGIGAGCGRPVQTAGRPPCSLIRNFEAYEFSFTLKGAVDSFLPEQVGKEVAMRRILLIAFLTFTAACGPKIVVQGSNYLTFDHEFTDKAGEQVAKRAEALCAQTKQAAEKVSSTCSLKRCTTNYQCVDPAAKPAAK